MIGAWVAAQTALVVVGLVALRVVHRRVDLANPLVVLLVMWLFVYTFQIIPLWDGTDLFSRFVATWLPGDRADQMRAAALETAGLAAVIVGYLAAGKLGRRVRERKPRSSLPERRAGTVVGLGIMLVALLIVASHGFAALGANLYDRTQFLSGKNYLAMGPTVVEAAALALFVADRRWPPRRRTVVVFAVGALLSLLTGSKTSIAVPVIGAAAVVYYLWHRFKVVPVVLVSVVFLASLSFYDLYFRNALPRHISVAQAFDDLGGWSGVTDVFVGDALFGHQAMVIAIAKFGPVVPHPGLPELGAVITAPIPHALYPAKHPAPSAAFTEAMDPQLLAAGTSIPPTALGELYMDFGGWGVVVGAAVLGALIRVVYDRRLRSASWMYTSALLTAIIGPYLRGETYGDGVLFLILLLPGLYILSGVPLRTPDGAMCDAVVGTVTREGPDVQLARAAAADDLR